MTTHELTLSLQDCLRDWIIDVEEPGGFACDIVGIDRDEIHLKMDGKEWLISVQRVFT